LVEIFNAKVSRKHQLRNEGDHKGKLILISGPGFKLFIH